ncbi:MAG TPA: alpha/beta fold hydrolase [Pyrinomonadaceae bacterium]|nr:alpha/beta fold hydrolase [Pyrinomonadaceae bacterium]
MATFPILLVHGIARFDIFAVILRERLKIPDNSHSDQFDYFKGIKNHLEANGFTVSAPNLAFAGSIDLRAEGLINYVNDVLQRTGSQKVHIIAHSMGGLDARHMIVDKGMADRVATLTTIGTPHHGTSVADEIARPGGQRLVQELDRLIDVDGFADLTTAACEQFNRRAEDAEAKNGIAYQTYAAWEKQPDIFAPLVPSWFIVSLHEGKNDGLVSVRSQQWTPELIANDGTRKPVAQQAFPFQADHLNELGWWDLEEAIIPLFSGVSIVQQALNYEQRVRDLYLQIAQGLP